MSKAPICRCVKNSLRVIFLLFGANLRIKFNLTSSHPPTSRKCTCGVVVLLCLCACRDQLENYNIGAVTFLGMSSIISGTYIIRTSFFSICFVVLNYPLLSVIHRLKLL